MYEKPNFVHSGTYYVDCEISHTHIDTLSMSIPSINGYATSFNGIYMHSGGGKEDGSTRINLAYDVCGNYCQERTDGFVNRDMWIPLENLKNDYI